MWQWQHTGLSDASVYAQAYDEWEAELAVQEAKQARAQVKARGKAGKASAKGRAAWIMLTRGRGEPS